MTFEEIQDLIRLIKRSKLTEFKMKRGDFEISIRTQNYTKEKTVQQTVVPAAPVVTSIASPAPTSNASGSSATETPQSEASPQPAEGAGSESSGDWVEIKSPMVGTFYRSPAPEKGPYVKVGDRVETGSVVCIIEAMKLFNEIESEVSGKIVKVMIEDANPVEYDQVLFLVDPNG